MFYMKISVMMMSLEKIVKRERGKKRFEYINLKGYITSRHVSWEFAKVTVEPKFLN